MFHFFRKDIEKRCAYCECGSVINDTEVVCSRRGIVNATEHCRRFRYDPLKRVPPRPAVLDENKHSAEEFSL
ncbi:MAG: hypothetical protein PUJ93_05850 [Oscillospiraceae bacterium]|nr:hypothetical protein [Oscillospiraceae bacterium]MDD5807933.1 hypothetical protein [Oscillospiraceae bacterium]MDD7538490.1 hypothetical protein [Oscillospiraceae bacterium]MDY5735885.1 hypothetical protein [Oscillospiraceae bacterium]MDY6020218.1 hypothetical protein [Oscillospiraceae bacterium]